MTFVEARRIEILVQDVDEDKTGVPKPLPHLFQEWLVAALFPCDPAPQVQFPW